MDIASAVFPGEVWRNSLYHRRTNNMNSTSQNDDIQSSCLAATHSFSFTCTMHARHNLNKCNWRPVDWLISINSNTPAGSNHLKSHFVRSQCRRRTVNHCSINGKAFGIHCIHQKTFLKFIRFCLTCIYVALRLQGRDQEWKVSRCHCRFGALV